MSVLELVFLAIIVYLLIGLVSLFIPFIKGLLANETEDISLFCCLCVLMWPILVICIIIQWFDYKSWWNIDE